MENGYLLHHIFFRSKVTAVEDIKEDSSEKTEDMSGGRGEDTGRSMSRDEERGRKESRGEDRERKEGRVEDGGKKERRGEDGGRKESREEEGGRKESREDIGKKLFFLPQNILFFINFCNKFWS
jgi:hypothetical protein